MTAARIPFAPHYGSNVQVTAGAASLTLTLTAGDDSVRIVNDGANIAFVRTFKIINGAASATAADCPCRANSTTILHKLDDDRLAYLSPLGATLQVGTGISGY